MIFIYFSYILALFMNWKSGNYLAFFLGLASSDWFHKSFEIREYGHHQSILTLLWEQNILVLNQLVIEFLYFFFFSFFFGATQQHMELQSQGSDPSHSCELSRSCANTGPLIHCDRTCIPRLERCHPCHWATAEAPSFYSSIPISY